ncbi:MAG: NADH-quinone oxidoreductase subunit M, partial [Candidatus Latescibacterota bacterium]
MLLLIVVLPLAGGLTAWLVARDRADRSRYVSVAFLALDLLLLIATAAGAAAGAPGRFLVETRLPWVPGLGSSLHLGLDGLSLIMLGLTLVLGAVAVAASGPEAEARPGLYHLLLMATLSALAGVFLAADLLVFFVAYEAMLVPAYLLVARWGDPRLAPRAAATRFFVYTQAGGLLLLVSIVGLGLLQAREPGSFSLDYPALLERSVPLPAAAWLLAGLFLAFAVKLPLVPLHGWQADTYAAAPTGAGIVLAGLMAKAGGYGLVRLAVPLLPEAARLMAPWAMGLAVCTVLYGAVLALTQTDLRRFIAYSSMSHLGFVALGAFAGNDWGYRGAVVQMVSHGLSATGLFLLTAWIERGAGTRDLSVLRGAWRTGPRTRAFGLVLALATLGLPGLSGFVGEFLVLVGTFQVSPWLAAAASLGLVLSTAYTLRLVQLLLYGPDAGRAPIPDLTCRTAALAA